MPLQETPSEEFELYADWQRIECTGFGDDENLI